MSTTMTLVQVTDQEFASTVLASDTPMIVDFWAPWCPSCRALAPVYEKLSQQYAGKLRFATMNVDEHPATASHLGIQALPTLIVFQSGKLIGRLVGPPPARLKQAIDHVLAENNVA